MKHKIGFNRLGRKASHRKSLHRNMTTSLFRYERIKTTKAKALAIRRTAEKMITRAKEDSVHNRRIVNKDIKDKEVLAKLFTELGPRFKERPGGYTRILKLGYRQGDAAEMVLLELVEEEVAEQKKGKKKTVKKAKPTQTDKKEKTAEKVEEKTEEEPVENTEEKAEEAKAQPEEEAEVESTEKATEAEETKTDEAPVKEEETEKESSKTEEKPEDEDTEKDKKDE